MSQLPHQLTIPGPDGLPRDAVRAPCKTGYRTTDNAPCCGPGCLLYKAVRCNQICGIPTPAAIYVCKDTLCICSASYTNCPPCNRPIEDGMFVRYGSYCYKIQTGTIYCPEFGAKMVAYLAGRSVGRTDGVIDGCTPLPQGAEVAPPGTIVDCCKQCFPANGCPEIQGWFPMVQCPCPSTGSTNCVVYVSCQAYFSSLNTSNCPVWSVGCQTGGTRCLTVRPDAVPVQDPPPGAILIQSRAPYRNCCQCCGSGGGVLGCCYEVFTPKTTTWTNGVVHEVLGVPLDCCRVAAQSTYQGSAVYEFWFRYPDGHRCLQYKYVAKVQPIAGGGAVVDWQDYTYGGPPGPDDCATVSSGNSGQDIIHACTNAAQLLGMLLGLNQPGQDPGGNGIQELACDRASVNYSSFGNPTQSEHRLVGTAAVSSAEGCGNLNCQPGGGNRPADMTAPATGCSGCGSSAAATKF